VTISIIYIIDNKGHITNSNLGFNIVLINNLLDFYVQQTYSIFIGQHRIFGNKIGCILMRNKSKAEEDDEIIYDTVNLLSRYCYPLTLH